MYCLWTFLSVEMESGDYHVDIYIYIIFKRIGGKKKYRNCSNNNNNISSNIIYVIGSCVVMAVCVRSLALFCIIKQGI